jgi:hypothetical protein
LKAVALELVSVWGRLMWTGLLQQWAGKMQACSRSLDTLSYSACTTECNADTMQVVVLLCCSGNNDKTEVHTGSLQLQFVECSS